MVVAFVLSGKGTASERKRGKGDRPPGALAQEGERGDERGWNPHPLKKMRGGYLRRQSFCYQITQPEIAKSEINPAPFAWNLLTGDLLASMARNPVAGHALCF